MELMVNMTALDETLTFVRLLRTYRFAFDALFDLGIMLELFRHRK